VPLANALSIVGGPDAKIVEQELDQARRAIEVALRRVEKAYEYAVKDAE